MVAANISGMDSQAQKPPQSKTGLPSGPSSSDMIDELNNTNTRIKIIEERYENMRRKVQVIEQNMLSEDKKITTEMNAGSHDILAVKRDIEDLKDKMRLIIKEVKLSAKAEDVDELKKYIELWEPLNFVTRNELKKVLEGDIKDIIQQELNGRQ